MYSDEHPTKVFASTRIYSHSKPTVGWWWWYNTYLWLQDDPIIDLFCPGWYILHVRGELKHIDWPVKYASPIPSELFIAVVHETNFKQPIV